MKVKHLVGAFLCVLGCYACSSPNENRGPVTGRTYQDDIDGRRKRQTVL